MVEPILAVLQEPALVYRCFSNIMSFAHHRFEDGDDLSVHVRYRV